MQNLFRILVAIAAIALVSGCKSDGDMMSGGNVDPVPCDNDADCDDGLFCNGAESCDLGLGLCAPGTSPCPTGCSEPDDGCLSVLTLEVQGFTTSVGAGCFALGEPYTAAGASVGVIPPPLPPSATIGQALSGNVVSVSQSFRQDSTAAGGFGYSCAFSARLFADGVEIGENTCDTASAQGILSCTATIDALVP